MEQIQSESFDRENILKFQGTLKKIRIISNNICYGVAPQPDEEVEQRITINDKGRIWFSGYNFGNTNEKLEKARTKIFKIEEKLVSELLNAIANYFKNGYTEIMVTDIGKWIVELTNTDGKVYIFQGSLCSHFSYEGVNLSDFIRNAVGMNDLYVFDGDFKEKCENNLSTTVTQLCSGYLENKEINGVSFMENKSISYLIDYENVSYKGLYGISEVKSGDEILIFYSNDISIINDIISVYEKSGIKIKYFKLDKVGKNALDFMISAYAGYIASKECIDKIAILSNDKEYASITKVIENINPEIELAFESCIYNVNHTDNKKDILLPRQPIEKCDITSNKAIATSEKSSSDVQQILVDLSMNVNNVSPDCVKEYLNNHTTIPNKYKTSVSGIIAKCIKAGSNENEVSLAIKKQLGNKSDNATYIKEAIACYKKLKVLK